jgi:hypothetical protein
MFKGFRRWRRTESTDPARERSVLQNTLPEQGQPPDASPLVSWTTVDTRAVESIAIEQLVAFENREVPVADRASDSAEARADEKQDPTTTSNFPLHWTTASESWNYIFEFSLACVLLAPRPDGGKAPSPLRGLPEKIVRAAETTVEAAAKAGIRRGDVIQAVNNQEVKSVEELNRLLSPVDRSRTVAVLIKRGEGSVYIPLKLATN